MAGGVLAVWTDVAPRGEAQFNEWYNREHVPERVGVPGFKTGFRYRAAAGQPKYFAWYETRSTRVLASPAYRKVLNNPTDWTRRVMPNFRNTTRLVCRVRAKLGRGHGAVAATIRLMPGEGRSDALDGWLAETALPRAMKMKGIVGAQLWTLDAAATGGPSAESRYRGPDATVARAVLLEAGDLAAARTACRTLLANAILRKRGAAAGIATGYYRLIYGLER
jgi:hypothetical protein